LTIVDIRPDIPAITSSLAGSQPSVADLRPLQRMQLVIDRRRGAVGARAAAQ
jgi:hypothetical protein